MIKLTPKVLWVLVVWLVCAPAAYAQKSDRDTPKARTESQPYLGLGVAPMHPALAKQLHDIIGNGQGVLVAEVMEGSPAEKAGLQQYDILLSYNEQKLYSPEQLVKLVRNDEVGQEVKIGYVRSGKSRETTVTLTEKPARQTNRGLSTFRPPLTDRFTSARTERREQEPDSESERRVRTPWTTFKSLTITKLDDDRYRAEIEYRDRDQKALHRKYEGTREEIRKSIEADKDLPADERAHLLRSLDQQPIELFAPQVFRSIEDLERELFNWPHLEF